MLELVLSPGRRPGRYDVRLDGDLIVEGSRDPEHDAARELVRRGVTGVMATRWAGSPHLATRPRPIKAVAGRAAVERVSRGLQIEPYRVADGQEAPTPHTYPPTAAARPAPPCGHAPRIS